MNEKDDIFLNEINTPTEHYSVGSPDEIAKDIARAEKEMASEALKLLRSRHEKQKSEWRDIIKEKERCILELNEKIEKANSLNKSLNRQLNQERHAQIDQVKIQAKDIELRKAKEKKKWDMIEDEINKFRNETLSAQKKVYDEHEHSRKLRGKFDAIIIELKERIRETEESYLLASEQIALKEQSFLNEKARMDEQVHILTEEVESQKSMINDEKLFFKKSIEKKDSELNIVQKALQETIVNLNKERTFTEELEEKMAALQKLKESIEIKLQRAKENVIQSKAGTAKSIPNEQVPESVQSEETKHNVNTKEGGLSEK